LSDIWNTLGALVGASAVVAAVAGFVPKFIADRKIESHKTDLARELERLKSELSNEAGIPKWRLKRAELLFAKQVEAGSAFIAFRRYAQNTLTRIKIGMRPVWKSLRVLRKQRAC
jgi:hypothetical protein